jgi:hypothetical protein
MEKKFEHGGTHQSSQLQQKAQSRITVQQVWAKRKTLSPKYPEHKGLETWPNCLPSKCEALSSNPSTAKKTKSV